MVEQTTLRPRCPRCQGAHVVKNGPREGEQRYLCRICKKQFSGKGTVHGHRYTPEIIGAAICGFYAGMIYEEVTRYVAEKFGIKEPSLRSVHQWVSRYTGRLCSLKPIIPLPPAHTWGVYVFSTTVRDKTYWTWGVVDAEHGYILACRHYEEDDLRAEGDCLWAALQRTGASPDKVLANAEPTPTFAESVERTLPWTSYETDNAVTGVFYRDLSTKLQDLVERRDYILEKFCSLHEAQDFLDVWTIRFNLVRHRERIRKLRKGGDAVGAMELRPLFHRWPDVVKTTRHSRSLP